MKRVVFILLSIVLLGLIGCQDSIEYQNFLSKDYALYRFRVLDKEVVTLLGSTEALEDFAALKKRRGKTIEETCFSKVACLKVDEALKNEIVKILTNTPPEATPETINIRIETFLAFNQAMWQKTIDDSGAKTTQNQALAYGISERMYERSLSYYRAVERALDDIRQHHRNQRTSSGVSVPSMGCSGCGCGGLILLGILAGIFALLTPKKGVGTNTKTPEQPQTDSKIDMDQNKYRYFQTHINMAINDSQIKVEALCEKGQYLEAKTEIRRQMAATRCYLQEIRSYRFADPLINLALIKALEKVLNVQQRNLDLIEKWDQTEADRGRQRDSTEGVPRQVVPVPFSILFAMNRLEIPTEELPTLTKERINEGFKAIMKLIHPDVINGKTEQQNEYFTEQTKRLSQAREDLLSYIAKRSL